MDDVEHASVEALLERLRSYTYTAQDLALAEQIVEWHRSHGRHAALRGELARAQAALDVAREQLGRVAHGVDDTAALEEYEAALAWRNYAREQLGGRA